MIFLAVIIISSLLHQSFGHLVNNPILFTSYEHEISVCEPQRGRTCIEGTPVLFYSGNLPIIRMDLGFLKNTTFSASLEYDASKFGIPIFHLRDQPSEAVFSIEFAIANGTRKDPDHWNYYYTQFETNNDCQFPMRSDYDYLSGSLYFNQKYAKYAYYVYQGTHNIFIYSFKFEDMLQGNYSSGIPVKIHPVNITIIKNHEVEKYKHPFFTVDPIYGAMVHLTVTEDAKFNFVYHKLDENNLGSLEKVFEYSPSEPFPDHPIVKDLKGAIPVEFCPTFQSYGKSVFLYVRDEYISVAIGEFWPHQNQTSHIWDRSGSRQRRLHYFNATNVEFGEPIGKYSGPTAPTTCVEYGFLDGSIPGIITISIIGFLDLLLLLIFILLILLFIKGRQALKDDEDGVSVSRSAKVTESTTNIATTEGGGKITYDQTTGTTQAALSPMAPAPPMTQMTSPGVATKVPQQTTVLKTFE